MVWNRNRILALFPFLLLCGDTGASLPLRSHLPFLKRTRTAAGIMACYELTQIGTNFVAEALSQRTQAFYSLTLSLNVICTCECSAPRLCICAYRHATVLIAYRIWSIQRETASISSISSGGTSLTRVVSILIESCEYGAHERRRRCHTDTGRSRCCLLHLPVHPYRNIRCGLPRHVHHP